MANLLGIQFAPLNIPFSRRLQTFAVLQWTLSFLFLGPACLVLFIYLLFTRFYFIPIFYFVWYLSDLETPKRGGRPVTWVQNWRIWKYYKDYFPIKLIKTADLDPKKNYIFGFHPHGIMSDGAFCNFGTHTDEFQSLFPGLRPRLMTLNGLFYYPFHREYFLSIGTCSCNKESVNWLLSYHGLGNALVLVVGGAAEALEAHPGSFTLKLSNRKGFIRIALKHGASLVPVFSFGENDLFDQVNNPEGSLLRRFQLRMTKILGISIPFFHGRGVFNYSFGIMPYRRPINTVVGAPIHVEQVADPSREQIEELHQKYVTSLQDLFETNKSKFGVDKMQHITIL